MQRRAEGQRRQLCACRTASRWAMPARAATTARSAASQAGAGAPAAEDTRVLVDRLWPRELSRERAGADLGVRDIAPSVAVRRRFHGSPTAWK